MRPSAIWLSPLWTTPRALSAFSPCFCFLSFFVSWCAVPRCLHSFPTRRSSDLQATLRRMSAVYASKTPSLCVFRYFVNVSTRSEEHTSELQSPCNLVCRLLLEKKKMITLFAWYLLVYLSSLHWLGVMLSQ